MSDFSLARAHLAASHALIVTDQRAARGRHYNPHALPLMLGRLNEAEDETARQLGASTFEAVMARSDPEALIVYESALKRFGGTFRGSVGDITSRAVDRARAKLTKHGSTR